MNGRVWISNQCLNRITYWYHSFSFRLALTKFVALSEYITMLFPRRSKNLFNARIKASVLRSLTSSTCIDRVAKQIKTLTYDFTFGAFLRLLVLTIKGPAKSTPHLRNARPGDTRCLGRSPIIGCIIIGFCLKQITHLFTMFRAKFRPLIGQ